MVTGMGPDRLADLRAAYALFLASERLDGAMIQELVSTYGAEALVNGLLSVCTGLRKALLDHTEGCWCGGDDWLEHQLYQLAGAD